MLSALQCWGLLEGCSMQPLLLSSSTHPESSPAMQSKHPPQIHRAGSSKQPPNHNSDSSALSLGCSTWLVTLHAAGG